MQDVAALQAGAVGRTAIADAANHELAHVLDREDAEPGTRRRRQSALRHQLLEDRLEPVDGHVHVAGEGRRARTQRLLHQQRADAQQRAVVADQCRATPQRIGRHGEDRVVQKVFPVAGKLAAASDLHLERRLLATHARNVGLAAQLQRIGIAEHQMFQPDRLLGADQAEAAFVVVADDVGGPVVAIDVGDGDGVGFHDQVADGDDQAILADQDTVALALCAQRLGRAAVLRDGGAQADHRRERAGHRRRQIGNARQPRLNGLSAGGNMTTRPVRRTVQPSGHRQPPPPARTAPAHSPVRQR